MKKRSDWKLHKDDPTWPYDEYGFAKGLSANHPARGLIRAIEKLSGTDDEFDIEDNYTEEWQAILDKELPGALGICVTMIDSISSGICFDFDTRFEGRRYRASKILSRYEIERNKYDFDVRLHDLMRDALTALRWTLFEICPICQGRRVIEKVVPPWNTFMGYVECSNCSGKGIVRKQVEHGTVTD